MELHKNGKLRSRTIRTILTSVDHEPRVARGDVNSRYIQVALPCSTARFTFVCHGLIIFRIVSTNFRCRSRGRRYLDRLGPLARAWLNTQRTRTARGRKVPDRFDVAQACTSYHPVKSQTRLPGSSHHPRRPQYSVFRTYIVARRLDLRLLQTCRPADAPADRSGSELESLRSYEFNEVRSCKLGA